MSDEDWNEILLNEELSDDLSLQCQVQKRSQWIISFYWKKTIFFSQIIFLYSFLIFSMIFRIFILRSGRSFLMTDQTTIHLIPKYPWMSLSLIPAIALQGISGWASRIVGERFFTASPIISIERGMERLKSGSSLISSRRRESAFKDILYFVKGVIQKRGRILCPDYLLGNIGENVRGYAIRSDNFNLSWKQRLEILFKIKRFLINFYWIRWNGLNTK